MSTRDFETGPVDNALQERMAALGEIIERDFPGSGIIVVVFDFDEQGDEIEGNIQYMSNAKRADAIMALLDLARLLERHG